MTGFAAKFSTPEYDKSEFYNRVNILMNGAEQPSCPANFIYRILIEPLSALLKEPLTYDADKSLHSLESSIALLNRQREAFDEFSHTKLVTAVTQASNNEQQILNFFVFHLLQQNVLEDMKQLTKVLRHDYEKIFRLLKPNEIPLEAQDDIIDLVKEAQKKGREILDRIAKSPDTDTIILRMMSDRERLISLSPEEQEQSEELRLVESKYREKSFSLGLFDMFQSALTAAITQAARECGIIELSKKSETERF